MYLKKKGGTTFKTFKMLIDLQSLKVTPKLGRRKCFNPLVSRY